ncbi:CST complex subunit STN1 [Gracilariopsis chorda]|uniref:CST complex subunit STN1 n=1 Tax=Gracilariopsis chorda TaxID=448386 RepID=A0A2V3J089_9FLOR|nr:CST complex subunit STN1 [Gracilariopsis chorda]|eukprot:PXF47811.1 CST complex subunit STN1 [Gracilariopsis chorda]
MHHFYANHLNWALDPLFHVHVKLFNRMLEQAIPPATDGNNSITFYRYAPNLPARPLRLVHIAGIVVYVNHHSKFSRYILDDGSSTARCLLWNDTEPAAQLALGDFVEVRGRLEWQKQILLVVVQSQQSLTSPYAELDWWLQVRTAHHQVYSQPFEMFLTPEQTQT